VALRNRLDICNHYDIAGENLDHFQRDVTKKGIILVHHSGVSSSGWGSQGDKQK
jgi:hypothetical protein